MAENSVVYQARLHWILFVWPMVLFLFAVILGVKLPQLEIPALLLAGVALIWEFIVWITYQFSLVIIKQKQVVLCSGIFVRKTVDISLEKIESIDIRQPILGTIFQYGTLIITGTGGSRQLINHINKPLTCRRYIEQIMHNPKKSS